MNGWDILIAAVIAACVVIAIVVIVRNRKKGKCTCGCEGCSERGRCGKKD